MLRRVLITAFLLLSVSLGPGFVGRGLSLDIDVLYPPQDSGLKEEVAASLDSFKGDLAGDLGKALKEQFEVDPPEVCFNDLEEQSRAAERRCPLLFDTPRHLKKCFGTEEEEKNVKRRSDSDGERNAISETKAIQRTESKTYEKQDGCGIRICYGDPSQGGADTQRISFLPMTMGARERGALMAAYLVYALKWRSAAVIFDRKWGLKTQKKSMDGGEDEPTDPTCRKPGSTRYIDEFKEGFNGFLKKNGVRPSPFREFRSFDFEAYDDCLSRPDSAYFSQCLNDCLNVVSNEYPNEHFKAHLNRCCHQCCMPPLTDVLRFVTDFEGMLVLGGRKIPDKALNDMLTLVKELCHDKQVVQRHSGKGEKPFQILVSLTHPPTDSLVDRLPLELFERKTALELLFVPSVLRTLAPANAPWTKVRRPKSEDGSILDSADALCAYDAALLLVAADMRKRQLEQEQEQEQEQKKKQPLARSVSQKDRPAAPLSLEEVLAELAKEMNVEGLTGTFWVVKKDDSYVLRRIPHFALVEKTWDNNKFVPAWKQMDRVPAAKKEAYEPRTPKNGKTPCIPGPPPIESFKVNGDMYLPLDVIRIAADFSRITRVDLARQSFDAEIFFWLRSGSHLIELCCDDGKIRPRTPIEFWNGLRTETERLYYFVPGRDDHVKRSCKVPCPDDKGESTSGKNGESTPEKKVPDSFITRLCCVTNARFLRHYALEKFPFDTQELAAKIFLPTLKSNTVRFAFDGFSVLRTEEFKEINKREGQEMLPREYELVDVLHRAENLFRRSSFGKPVRNPKGEDCPAYPVFTASLKVRRVLGPYWVRLFVPILILVILSISVYWISVREEFDVRFTVLLTSLLSAIVLHLARAESLPSVRYLTRADWCFILTYLIIGLNIIAVIILKREPEYLKRITDDSEPGIDKKLNSFFRLFVAGLSLGWGAWFALPWLINQMQPSGRWLERLLHEWTCLWWFLLWLLVVLCYWVMRYGRSDLNCRHLPKT